MTLTTPLRISTLFTLFLLLTTKAHAYARFKSNPPDSCIIEGDDEIYGKGIRISLYIQWAAAVLATWICPEQIKISRTGTNIVAFAVIINTLKGGNEGGLLVPELFIVTNLIFTLNLFNIPPGIALAKQSISSLGAMAVVLSIALFAGPWVWFKNVDQGRKEGCVIHLWFVFAPVNIYNKGWGTFFKVASIFEVIAGVTLVLAALGALLFGIYVSTSANGGGVFGVGEEEDFVASAVYRSIISVLQLVTGGVAIAMVERTIKVNEVELPQPMTSSGQLVPLIIGGVTMVATIGSGLKNGLMFMKNGGIESFKGLTKNA